MYVWGKEENGEETQLTDIEIYLLQLQEWIHK